MQTRPRLTPTQPDLLVALIDEIARSKGDDPHSVQVLRRVERASEAAWAYLATETGVELTDELRAAVIETYRQRATAPKPEFRVRYYDRRMSWRGQGVQVAIFADRADAEAFAARNRIYAGPCRVEVAS